MNPPKERRNELGYEIRELSILLGRYIENESAKMGVQHMKGPQAWALGFIKNQTGPVYQKDLEEELSIRKPTASRLIDRLEQKGFVKRVVSSTDKRWKQIILTEKAQKEMEQVDGFIASVEKKIKANLSAEEISTFKKIAGKIKANFATD
ncbi:MarR family winged helix-turn-helix transcriptional regulator [Enterococcus sp. HY326]|uniref:MarR family winged helix-turn-helix transcriptional regulator n=1 Tax=Enterococcus sp. HY326 TaxID=2971265 RepID=UPI002240E0B8|nr:MarR family winged helix-turn-helix transcriptional regulator [Enterococcus sp. HY326]